MSSAEFPRNFRFLQGPKIYERPIKANDYKSLNQKKKKKT